MAILMKSLASSVGIAAAVLVWGAASEVLAAEGEAALKLGGDVSGSTEGVDAKGTAESSASAESPPHTGTSERGRELQNTLDGATGLLRTHAADSGATGTFRLSFVQSYFTGSGFLCGSCALPGAAPSSRSDDVTQTGTRLGLSATPIEFLEAYAALRYQSTENSRSDPHAIQVMGDLTLGAKAFLPRVVNRVYSVGGGLDARFLGSPGGVGIDSASFGLRALSTLDLTRQERVEDRIPLRGHLNLGYLFDGSGAIADDTESQRRAVIGPNRITRIERFGHDINRVDTFRPSLGIEGVFPYVRPFAEWSVDVAVNRQGHGCGQPLVRSAGDGCLANAGFSSLPSRFTIGARAYPWVRPWLEGAALLAAVDIGTGGTSSFLEELSPERPWALHLGLAWAVDTEPKEKVVTVEKVVERELPAAAPERHIEGVVVRTGTSEPVPGAIVAFTGRPLSAMVADAQGKFHSAGLEPGEYALAVSAEGHKDGECRALVPANAADAAIPAGAPASGGGKAPSPVSLRPVVVNVTCTVEALPKAATITGVVRDAETTTFVEGATVTFTDPLGRTLALQTDAQGGFRFGNVLAGKSRIIVEAEKYLRGSLEIDLEARHDVTTQVQLHARPKTPNVVITKKELKLKKEVHFLHNSAEILPDSAALLEEAADVLRSHPEIAQVEVQGHTDNTGGADYNLKLSESRANAVRNALVSAGVDPSRVTARGYGQEKPLVPNTSAANKARNRRVQLVISK